MSQGDTHSQSATAEADHVMSGAASHGALGPAVRDAILSRAPEEEASIRSRLGEVAAALQSERERFRELADQHRAAMASLEAEYRDLHRRQGVLDAARRQVRPASISQ